MLFRRFPSERNAMQSNKYTHVVWDFNGTILDDVDACIKSANTLLSAYDLPLIESKESYRKVFGFPIIDSYRRLGFDFDKLPYSELAVEWVAYYLENSKTSTVYEGLVEVFEAVKARGLSQWILSATEKQMLTGQIESLGIRSYFDGILGLENIQAYSKREVGVQWRAQNPDARILMVGDTDHDAGVAAAMGADCILLTTGHQNRATLEQHPCLFVADHAREILGIL